MVLLVRGTFTARVYFSVRNTIVIRKTFEGWGSMVLGFITGALFCCNSFTSMRDGDENEPYVQGFNSAHAELIPGRGPYQAAKPMGHEYI